MEEAVRRVGVEPRPTAVAASALKIRALNADPDRVAGNAIAADGLVVNRLDHTAAVPGSDPEVTDIVSDHFETWLGVVDVQPDLLRHVKRCAVLEHLD